MINCVEVEIVEAKGSTPRDIGTKMWVSDKRQKGTIGGGRLEWEAARHARAILAGRVDTGANTYALGPQMGQCCGGSVTLSFTYRCPATRAPAPIYIFGGGHVGSALAASLRPHHPSVAVFDTRPGLGRTTVLPEAEIRRAPPQSAFVILTHDHALDFLLVEEALLRGDAAYVGMIGSASKRAQLTRRLHAKSIDAAPLICPIGASARPDKRPEIIALHVAAELLQATMPC